MDVELSSPSSANMSIPYSNNQWVSLEYEDAVYVYIYICV